MGKKATCLPSDLDKVLILVNPKAGRRSSRDRAGQLVDALRQRKLDAQIVSDLDGVTDQANDLCAQGRLRALVAVGGDGTAAELVNRTTPGVPLTLLAAGTANLLARHFRLPTQPERLAAMIASGVCRQLDAGRAGGRVFLLMAGCGFDAEVVRRVHESRHKNPRGGHISYASYLKPIWGAIRNYEYPEIRVYCDEPAGGPSPCSDVQPMVARWAFIFNLSRYGWGVELAPQADCGDGLLDLCTFRRGALWHGLRYLSAAQFGGWHQRLSDCDIRQAKRIRITSSQPVAYQLDGDPAGWLPLEIEVLPERFTLVVPPESQ